MKKWIKASERDAAIKAKREKLLWDIQQQLFGFREETDIDSVMKEIGELLMQYETGFRVLGELPDLGDVYSNEPLII